MSGRLVAGGGEDIAGRRKFENELDCRFLDSTTFFLSPKTRSSILAVLTRRICVIIEVFYQTVIPN